MTERDGYYAMSALCVGMGIMLLVTFIRPTVRRLQGEIDALQAPTESETDPMTSPVSASIIGMACKDIQVDR